jgi:DHA1 family inner membrane transport protein
MLIGLGLTVGNIIGGKLADRRLAATLIGVFIAMAVTSTVLTWTSLALIPAEITLFLWATACFAAVPALQINVVTFGKDAPNLVSTLNIGAFNVGNALGAWVGGSVIAPWFRPDQRAAGGGCSRHPRPVGDPDQFPSTR